MKFSTLLLATVGTSATVNAISLNSIKQKVYNEASQIFLGENTLTSFLSKFPTEFNYATIESNPELFKIWDDLKSVYSDADLESKVNKYVALKHPKTFNNKAKGLWDSFKEEFFEVFASPKFANHSLRVKSNSPEILGLDTVKQYTGYLDINDVDKHFFYWFFESRNDPKNDPIILWLNGGPGCSSTTGLFFQLGPSSINSKLRPVYNPHSWNSNASVIFLDQPVGVGYSYTGGEKVSLTAAAAKDVYVFLELFFQKFPQFLTNKFHIAGELYAGHYIPSFALEITNQADRSFELLSVLIGNGITDPLIQYGYYKPMACGQGGYPQVITDEECEIMDNMYPKCAFLTKLCYNSPSALTCVPANLYCESMMEPYTATGLNPYDIRKPCADEGGNCYTDMDYIDEYLNSEFVKNAVGASNIDIFTGCDDTVFRNFILDGDELKPFQQFVAELLEKDIPVLLYAGDKDYICNWLGNHAWSDALEYLEHEEFAAAPMKDYISLAGSKAGEVKNHGIFTFLRLYDAGHMVPFDQPENALDMVNRWVAGDYSFGSKKY